MGPYKPKKAQVSIGAAPSTEEMKFDDS